MLLFFRFPIRLVSESSLGHSLSICFLSDINLDVTLHQLSFVTSLQDLIEVDSQGPRCSKALEQKAARCPGISCACLLSPDL